MSPATVSKFQRFRQLPRPRTNTEVESEVKLLETIKIEPQTAANNIGLESQIKCRDVTFPAETRKQHNIVIMPSPLIGGGH